MLSKAQNMHSLIFYLRACPTDVTRQFLIKWLFNSETIIFVDTVLISKLVDMLQ